MFVYRVETKEGMGPYYGNNQKLTNYFRSLNGGIVTAGPRHPIPDNDGLNVYAFQQRQLDHDNDDVWSDTLFGFESLISLDRWFDAEMRPKINKIVGKKHQFHISVYKVLKKYTASGKSQMVFLRPKAKCVKILKFETLEEIILEKSDETPKVNKKPKVKRTSTKAKKLPRKTPSSFRTVPT